VSSAKNMIDPNFEHVCKFTLTSRVLSGIANLVFTSNSGT